MTNCEKILAKFPELVSWIQGPKERNLTKTSAPQYATAAHLVFIHSANFIDQSLSSECLTFVVPENCVPLIQSKLSEQQTLLTTPNIQLAKTFISKEFFPITANKPLFDEKRIHPSSVIAKSAEISDSAIIGPLCTIGENVKIGSNSYVGPNTTIEANVTIGRDCHIHAQVLLGHGSTLGNECIIQSMTTIGSIGFGYAQNSLGESFHTPHYGNVVLEDRVEVGAGVNIDRGNLEDSVFGLGTKLDNHCHFGHNFTCGKYNLITAGFISAGSVKMGDYNIIAGRSGILGHLKLGSHIMLSALSVVTKNLEKPGTYGGYPALPLKDFLRNQISITKLPQIRKSLKKLLQKAELDNKITR